MTIPATLPDDIAEKLKLPEVGQIGYVVRDVGETIAFCRDMYGIRPWMILEERPDPCIERGKEVHPVLRIGLAYAGPAQLELIQVVEGETFHSKHLEKPEAEVHHLGFMVQDLEKRLDACSGTGIEVLQRGTIRESGFNVDYAYLDTVEQAGIVLELIQWRLGPIPIPINRSMHNLVSRLGSATIFRGRIIK